MPQLEYFIVAESISVDRETNRVSIFNVIEKVGAPELPFVLPKLVSVACFLVEPDDGDTNHTSVLRVTSPSGEVTNEFAVDVDIQAGVDRQRLHMQILGIKFDSEGQWVVDLEFDDVHAASHTITVVQLPQPG